MESGSNQNRNVSEELSSSQQASMEKINEAMIKHAREIAREMGATGILEGKRKILDPSLKEAIHEFVSIDAAFLIRDDGVILAAGWYRFHLSKPGQCHRGETAYCANQEEKREMN